MEGILGPWSFVGRWPEAALRGSIVRSVSKECNRAQKTKYGRNKSAVSKFVVDDAFHQAKRIQSKGVSFIRDS
jgi:hypothetical protein